MEREQGISLVALIITIIVLIILTGAVIITMNQGDIIGKSEEAVFKSNITNYQDELSRKVLDKQLKGEISGMSGVTVEVKQLGEEGYENYVNNIKEYIPSIKEEDLGKVGIKEGKIYYSDTTNEEEFEWAAELDVIDKSSTLAGQVEVGDYIKYTPGEGIYEATSAKTGYGTQAYIHYFEGMGGVTPTIENEDQTFTSTATEEIWRVLSIDGANVTIVRGEPIVGSETLRGETGLILFGEAGYNNAIEELNNICKIYKNETQAKEARSITIEDINKVTGYTPIESENPAEGEYGYIGYKNNMNTYYSYTGSNYILDTSSNEHTMIFKNNTINYWAASCCVDAYSRYASFEVRGVYSGLVSADNLCAAPGGELCHVCGVRPVVVLKSTVQFKNEAGQDGTSSNPWKLQ